MSDESNWVRTLQNRKKLLESLTGLGYVRSEVFYPSEHQLADPTVAGYIDKKTRERIRDFIILPNEDTNERDGQRRDAYVVYVKR